jgi:hypothetical protein
MPKAPKKESQSSEQATEPLFIVKGKDGKNYSDATTKEKAQAIMDRFIKEATADGKTLELFVLELEVEAPESNDEAGDESSKKDED